MVSEVRRAKPTERASKGCSGSPAAHRQQENAAGEHDDAAPGEGPSASPSQSVASTAVISGALPRAIG